jgi:FAD/FMN-containing dehydrogenase
LIHDATIALKNLLGHCGFSDDADAISPWLTDWRGRYTGRAFAMVSPANTDEVAAIIKIAAEYRIALVPQGGNSGMVAGATPDDSGNAILLSLRRMNAIIDADNKNGMIRCEAGVILQDLHDAAAKIGRRFPLTLGGKGSATIGGLIATNAGGTQVLHHGTMRNLVAGIQAVLPDGSIYDALSPLKKDNRGYDLKHLLIGSEGTLGAVTAATLITVPALIDRCVIWAGVDSPDAAYDLLMMLQTRQGQQLEGFEILPLTALNSVLKHIPGTRSPLGGAAPWHVLIELVQDSADQTPPAELAAALMEQALNAGLVNDAAISANESQADAFWKIRDSISEAERARGPAVQHDISVPVADMARFIATESPLIEAKFPGNTVIAFGHLGDGNIHYHVKAPDGIDPLTYYRDYAPAVTAHVYDRVIAYNGSISAEHGIGQAKIGELLRSAQPAQLLALRAIKMALDPDNIMNPGKLVPLA